MPISSEPFETNLRSMCFSHGVIFLLDLIWSSCDPQIQKCCEVLVAGKADPGVQSAVNAVRYSTKHFSDDDTADEVKDLFD